MPQIDAHPAALRQNVVWFGATSDHQLIPDLLRKGNIHQAVTMHVTDFSKRYSVPPKRWGCAVIHDQPCNAASILSLAPETGIHTLVTSVCLFLALSHWM